MSEQGKLPKTLTINQKGTDIGFLDNLGIFVPIHTKELAEEAVRRYNSHDKLVEANRWIPVSERLPELEAVDREGATQSPWVHITDGEKVIDAYYYDYTKREAKPNCATGKGWYCSGMFKEDITHWKPIVLPEQAEAALEGVK